MEKYNYLEAVTDDAKQAIFENMNDWDFADRAGLHVRYKWMTHTDENLSVNDWHMHYISAETKVWF